MRHAYIFALLFCCCIAGCLPAPYYQRQEPVPQDAWAYSFKPAFTFDITDTTVNYRPSLVIRHSQAYPYSNLWLLLYIKTPGDSMVKKERVNVPLADAGGKWLGRGMGEIYEQRLYMQIDSVKFNKSGTYQITLEQNMRVNPLPDVLNVGIRIEKGTARVNY